MTRPERLNPVGVLLIAAAICSCAMGPKRSVMLGLTHVVYVEKGTESPPVIFEAGMGDGLETWEPVFEGVAASARAIAYSRPGYAGGFFRREPDGKRSADDVAGTLKSVLEKTGAQPPYVLVGHSIGGSYVLRFAKLYPDDVAGIVLLDARLKEFRERCESEGFNLCTPPGSVATLLPDHVREELRGLEQTEAETPGPRELGAIPITVIAATKPPVYAPDELQRLWLSVQREFAEELANGRYVEAEGAEHYIHRDAPDLVIAEILMLVERIRGSEAAADAGLARRKR